MPMTATIRLTDLSLPCAIGTYAAGDTVPEAHLLDLDLQIDAALVAIAEDGMAHVFDYDPLVAEIGRLARDGHYRTQERLMTRIGIACAAHPEIVAMRIALRKRPVWDDSGSLGVVLDVPADEMARFR